MKLKERIDARLAKEQNALAAPKAKKKNHIQRAAARGLAGFFLLMLGLTLVSRAADGITIARVKTQTAKSGVLTNRITLSGQVKPQDDLAIHLPAGVRILDAPVKVGDRVKAGDILMTLDGDDIASRLLTLEEELRILNLRLSSLDSGDTPQENDTVAAAEEALEEARQEAQRVREKQDRSQERLLADLAEAEEALERAKADLAKKIEKTRKSLIEEAEKNLEQAKAALEQAKAAAEEAIDSAQYSYDLAMEGYDADQRAYDNALSARDRAYRRLTEAENVLAALEAAEEPDEEAIAAARQQANAAREAAWAAEEAVNALNGKKPADVKRAEEALKKTKEKWEKDIEKAQGEVEKAEKALSKAQARTDFSEEPGIEADGSVPAAEKAVQQARRALEDGGYSQEELIEQADRAVEKAEKALADAVEAARRQEEKNRQSDAQTLRQREIERLGYLSQRRQLEEKRQTLLDAAALGGQVAAPADGTVLEIMARGEETREGASAALLARADLGYVFEAQVDQKTAEMLAIGESGSLTYTREGKTKQVEAVIDAIGAPDDKGNVKVSATLTGDHGDAAGKLVITRRSGKQDTCLPLSALRSGSGGDYVLVLRESQSVLGTQQTVVSVPITVRDRDTETMSISAPLMWDDQVITWANKPIEEGDRVRLDAE